MFDMNLKINTQNRPANFVDGGICAFQTPDTKTGKTTTKTAKTTTV